MRGRNFDLLPRDLVAIGVSSYLDTSNESRFWVLDSVSPDGTSAMFRILIEVCYSAAADFRYLATPFVAPRSWWTDYIDETQSRGIEHPITEVDEMR